MSSSMIRYDLDRGEERPQIRSKERDGKRIFVV